MVVGGAVKGVVVSDSVAIIERGSIWWGFMFLLCELFAVRVCFLCDSLLVCAVELIDVVH